MADPMQQARELLAAEYAMAGSTKRADKIIAGFDVAPGTEYAIRAIAAALRAAPEGFVMVPVDLRLACDMWEAGIKVRNMGGSVEETWSAMLAARPQGVKDV